jgi:hypothetical protein
MGAESHRKDTLYEVTLRPPPPSDTNFTTLSADLFLLYHPSVTHFNFMVADPLLLTIRMHTRKGWI